MERETSKRVSMQIIIIIKGLQALNNIYGESH